MNNPRSIQKTIDDRIRGWFMEVRVKPATTVAIVFSVIYYQLKYDKVVDTAIEQINCRQFPDKVAQYADNLPLVWITYERETVLDRKGCITIICAKLSKGIIFSLFLILEIWDNFADTLIFICWAF